MSLANWGGLYGVLAGLWLLAGSVWYAACWADGNDRSTLTTIARWTLAGIVWPITVVAFLGWVTVWTTRILWRAAWPTRDET